MPTNSGIFRIATALIVVIVVIAGAVLAITGHISYADFIKDVATGVGLLGIGYGIDGASRP